MRLRHATVDVAAAGWVGGLHVLRGVLRGGHTPSLRLLEVREDAMEHQIVGPARGPGSDLVARATRPG